MKATIKVCLKRFISFHKHSVSTIELHEGTDIKAMTQQMGISLGEICVLSVNGEQASFDRILKDNDLVEIIPPIGGG